MIDTVTAGGWSANDTMVFTGDNGTTANAYHDDRRQRDGVRTTGSLEAEANTALTVHHGTMTSGVDVGGLQYAFGTSGGNGYLFFDPSHDNTTPFGGFFAAWEFQQVIELVGVTTFNPAEIHGA